MSMWGDPKSIDGTPPRPLMCLHEKAKARGQATNVPPVGQNRAGIRDNRNYIKSDTARMGGAEVEEE